MNMKIPSELFQRGLLVLGNAVNLVIDFRFVQSSQKDDRLLPLTN